MVKKKVRGTPPPEAMVVRILRDDGIVTTGQTVADVLQAGGRLIDSCMEPPAILFQVEGDPRWWVGTVEFCVAEAAPDYVQEVLAEEEAENTPT